jgi:L-aminopeptidase/D-esterase-like protein
MASQTIVNSVQDGVSGSIVDVPGLQVGHFTMRERLTGCSVVLAPGGAVGAVDVRGAAPGTRETDLLDPANLVDKVHAVVLSGGSAFGLDAATGVVRRASALKPVMAACPSCLRPCCLTCPSCARETTPRHVQTQKRATLPAMRRPQPHRQQAMWAQGQVPAWANSLAWTAA